jgi:hypothetical protein
MLGFPYRLLFGDFHRGLEWLGVTESLDGQACVSWPRYAAFDLTFVGYLTQTIGFFGCESQLLLHMRQDESHVYFSVVRYLRSIQLQMCVAAEQASLLLRMECRVQQKAP